MATETDSGYSGVIMSLVLVLFLAVGLIAWAAGGVTNSSTNPQITLPPATPCSLVAGSYMDLQNTLQSYRFGTATISEVEADARAFAEVTAHQLAALAPDVRQALVPVQAQLQQTIDLVNQPGATNREISDQTQKVAAAASGIPTLCHDSFAS